MAAIIEQERSIPVSGSYDVVVVGGGIAGCAAALAAVRDGARTLLIERGFAPGGLATIGNVNVYLPLCDGVGNQVTGGIAEELLLLSVADDPAAVPKRWRKSPTATAGRTDKSAAVVGHWGGSRDAQRYRVNFWPATLIMELERILLREGVTLSYDTRFCDVMKESGKIRYIIVENKDGRSAIEGRAFVDAGGDADLCARCGENTELLDTNVRSSWYFILDKGKFRRVTWTKHFTRDGSAPEGDTYLYDGTCAADVTRHMIDTRACIYDSVRELRDSDDAGDVHPLWMPDMPSFRMTRRLVAPYTLRFEDAGRRFEDSLGMFASWRESGLVFGLPYRTLYAAATANLAVAGRCISAAGKAWDLTRAIPACALSGEAAGLAASRLSNVASSFADLDPADLRTTLVKRGAILDASLLTPAKE